MDFERCLDTYKISMSVPCDDYAIQLRVIWKGNFINVFYVHYAVSNKLLNIVLFKYERTKIFHICCKQVKLLLFKKPSLIKPVH